MNDKKYVDLEDIRVPRNEQNEIIASEQETAIGIVKVRTMSYGDANEWYDKMQDLESVPNTDIANLLKRKVVKPDLSKLCKDGEQFNEKVMKREFKPKMVEIFLTAIFDESDFKVKANVNKDMSADLEMEGDSKNRSNPKPR